MNTTTTTAAALPDDAPEFPLARFAVLSALERMTAGCLHLTLPDGTLRHFGTPGAEITATVQVKSPAFFHKCLLFGDVGFGESYVDGDWTTDSIKKVVAWAILNVENAPTLSGSRTGAALFNLFKLYNRVQHLLRPNTVETAKRNITEHYDLGNDFYQLWLDPSMTYSSALFTAPDQTLEQAQWQKYDALCRHLRLKPDDHLLEIGSGWGGMACHAVKHYGCRVTTLTISPSQLEYAKARFEREGVAGRVEIRLQDYREVTGQFDKVVSIEMMEALGDKYLDAYFKKIHDVLKPGGLVALQYITVPDSRHAALRKGVDWIQKHVFPGSLLLSVGRVNESVNRTGDLFLHHLHDIGSSYIRTLPVWWKNFNENAEKVKALGFDDRFIRKWNYYLQYCEAAFDMRNISVVQAVYARPNNRLLHEPHTTPA